MNANTVIMVQIVDREWTMEALHCACLMARKMSATIALVEMIPVQHPSYLGTDLGYIHFSEEEQRDVIDYEETVEDYGVEFVTHVFQYMTLANAISQVADHVDARVVFATLPDSIFSVWRNFQLKGLRRSLARNHRELIEHPLYEPEALHLVSEAEAHLKGA
jgi:hypothetical protein